MTKNSLGERDKRPRILVFVRYYLPGFKSGGPVRSVCNLVQAIGNEYNFYIVCLNRDHGEKEPYSSVESGKWVRVGAAYVYYASQMEMGISFYNKIVKMIQPDLIYLNSIFDREFSIKPFLVLGRGKKIPILIAPRGELSNGAKKIKEKRKKIFIDLANAVGYYSRVYWQASSKTELDQIHDTFAPKKEQIFHVSNLPEKNEVIVSDKKQKKIGEIKIVIPARISRMKNTHTAIRIAGRLKGKVELNLWGPMEDVKYWEYCLNQIKYCNSNVSICYRGEIEHSKLQKKISENDVMLMPTLGENFGHSILEAISAGLPVVISDRTPWRSLKEEGVGADIPLENEEEFVQQLEKYCSYDEEAMAIVRQQCRNYAATWKEKNTSLSIYREMFKKINNN